MSGIIDLPPPPKVKVKPGFHSLAKGLQRSVGASLLARTGACRCLGWECWNWRENLEKHVLF